MGLVDYSDSDDSANESKTKPAQPSVSKSGFQKVVDRSNPGRIKVSLPQPSSTNLSSAVNEPPAKRAKLGGGGLGGFNSFLPAPKRAAASTAGKSVAQGSQAGGIGLKTGATPGFSREPESGSFGEAGSGSEQPLPEALSNGLALPALKEQQTLPNNAPEEEVKLVGKPLMFKPLSVSRKPAKKKQPPSGSSQAHATEARNVASKVTVEPIVPKPKVSLFSITSDIDDSTIPAAAGEYKPLLFGAKAQTAEEAEPDDDLDNYQYEETTEAQSYASTTLPTPGTQSLDNIASDLNLSAAERRQLFGRQKGSQNGGSVSAHKIINFNTDDEWKHNEELRAAGEQVTHNPVRSIAPGKHSLKQLVNAVQSQKDALEESFARGKSNKAEAGSRYGW